jgi:hypothetical protein
MCGPSSALGLADTERALWPVLRERLRVPGQLMGLMRGLLGGDAEVGVVVATSPAGIAVPLAILVTPSIVAEIAFADEQPGGDVRPAVSPTILLRSCTAAWTGPSRPRWPS